MFTYLATYEDDKGQLKKLVRVAEKATLYDEVRRVFGLKTDGIELHADGICFRETGDLDWFPDRAKIVVYTTREGET